MKTEIILDEAASRKIIIQGLLASGMMWDTRSIKEVKVSYSHSNNKMKLKVTVLHKKHEKKK